MRMIDHLEAIGAQLFKRRGSLPTLILLPVLLLALADFRYPHGSQAADRVWEIVCFLIALVGLAIRVAVSGTAPEGTSGRNVDRQRADELNTTGIYSVVRHPLYVGNFIMGLGIALQPRVWYVPVIAGLAFALYYERVIIAEEAFLERRFGDAFRAWANSVPIVIPNWRGYQPARLAFSWRAAVRREFYGLAALVAIFFMLDLLEDLVQGALALDPLWTTLFVIMVAAFFVLRELKHRTDVLRRR
jgi:protein-S-isoprenylcysteine O-methyltransferase Ste14